MSGSKRDEWDAYLKGNEPENYNFSYQRPIQTTTMPSQTERPVNKLIITTSPNKAINKRNHLPPPPSMAMVRGGKRTYRQKPRRIRRKTHKKKRQY